MKAYAGASGIYPIPRFRVVLDGGVTFHLHAESESRAKHAAETMYGREVLEVTLDEDAAKKPSTKLK